MGWINVLSKKDFQSMKYIKYFETREYFQEIHEISPIQIFRQNIEFTQEEIDIIRKFIDSKSDILHLYKNPKGNDLQILDKGAEICFIYKVKDEWYYLFRNDQNKNMLLDGYKCDQMEGLLKCIETIILY